MLASFTNKDDTEKLGRYVTGDDIFQNFLNTLFQKFATPTFTTPSNDPGGITRDSSAEIWVKYCRIL